MVCHEPADEVIPTKIGLSPCSKQIAIFSLEFIFTFFGIDSICKVGVIQLVSDWVPFEEEFMDLLEALDGICLILMGPEIGCSVVDVS